MSPSSSRGGMISSCLALSLVLSTHAAALANIAPLKVDFSIPGRADSAAPHYEQWFIKGGSTEEKQFGPITLTLSKSGAAGTSLKSIWWKGGAIDGARMAVDGVSVADGDAGGTLELRIKGLSPGRHSLVSYHNISEDDSKLPYGKIDITVNGTVQVRNLAPSHRALDEAAASGFVTFDVGKDEEVVVQFRPSDSDKNAERRNVILCGLELDTSNPALRARQPLPVHGDEHAATEQGTLTLSWAPASSAIKHQVYLSQNRAAAANATPQSPEYRGSFEQPVFKADRLDPLGEYFWRIDEVDAQGNVTRGEVWSFRPRQLAFPGAEGYGRFALGGRGGRVIEVTNLNDSGPGSLRAAVEADGPRTVVFAVSGLITLESKLAIRNPYLTVAGQTAPGKGITIRKYNFGSLGAHDVVIRHVRVRPGNIAGITLDGMGMASSNHTIYDHCSISWTIDEAFSSRGAKNITLQRTLISEALNIAGHKNYAEGKPHGYAASIGGDVGSFHHNLLAHCYGRNWSLAGGLSAADGTFTGRIDITNNVVYNWGHRATDGGAMEVNFVNNYYQPGPSTDFFYALNAQYDNFPGMQRYYFAGNVMPGKFDEETQKKGRTSTATNGGRLPSYENFVDTPFFPSYVETQSARAAYKIVLSDVGANSPALDDHDARVIAETLNNKTTYRGSRSNLAGMPDTQDDVGGWENYPETHRSEKWDQDHDGLPDWWESLHNTNPTSPAGDFSDANADRDGNGSTDLEDYLAWMAAPHTAISVDVPAEIDLSLLTRGFNKKPVHTVVACNHGELTLLPDGKTARFTPASGYKGLASFSTKVTDSENDSMTITVGILIL